VKKFNTYIGATDDPSGRGRPNGLSSPAFIDIDANGTVDIAYAGDLFGNLWKFDLKSSTPAEWKIAYGTSTAPEPLFVANVVMGGSTKDQPITSQPEVGYHPSRVGYLVYFGTGQYMEVNDNITAGATTQSFYSIWDQDRGSTNPNIDHSDLVEQVISSVGSVANGDGVEINQGRIVTQLSANWENKLGCFLDLTSDSGNQGERIVSNPLLRKDRIIFTTLLPSASQCEYGGSGWLMELDAYSCGRLDEVVLDMDEDGNFDADDTIDDVPPSGKKSKEGIIPKPVILTDRDKEFKYTSGSTGTIEVTTESGNNDFGRRTWRRVK
jgi:type IV pilus assembly protein PilY1